MTVNELLVVVEQGSFPTLRRGEANAAARILDVARTIFGSGDDNADCRQLVRDAALVLCRTPAELMGWGVVRFAREAAGAMLQPA